MGTSWKKLVAVYLFSMLGGLYVAFVAMNMWNWFIVPALHLSDISFLLMLGVVWTIGLLRAAGCPTHHSSVPFNHHDRGCPFIAQR